MLVIRSREGQEAERFKNAIKKMSESLDTICELADAMEDEYGERYSSRGYYSSRGDYSPREMYGRYSHREEEGWDERRHRY